ncbi:hypothetical protein DFS34DRAFT_672179 [Phlyctochytrium arcticum]|nr:hypothetical protein DFS34DRAFT_672179 [Phlyctochytrium arcticum]
MTFQKRKVIAKTSREQYYTNKELIDSLVTEMVPLLIKNDIEWFIDSSAGDGYLVFKLKQILPNINYVSYDLHPPDDTYSDVISQDFLKTKGDMNNVAIGFNPPYGVGCMLSVKFIRHAVKSYNANLICMILPHRATVARYDGFKLSYRRIVPKGSFYKLGTKKVFDYDAFWSVFEKGTPSPMQKLGTCIPQHNILGIQRFKPHAMLSKNILLIGRYYTKFKWHWITDIQFDHIPAHTEYTVLQSILKNMLVKNK